MALRVLRSSRTRLRFVQSRESCNRSRYAGSHLFNCRYLLRGFPVDALVQEQPFRWDRCFSTAPPDKEEDNTIRKSPEKVDKYEKHAEAEAKYNWEKKQEEEFETELENRERFT